MHDIILSFINKKAPDSVDIFERLSRIGGSTGEDSEDVVVSEIEVYVGECPAAPAIAGEYMRAQGVKSGSAMWRKAMKAVAGETGVNGSLWAANACEANYADNVQGFVDNLPS